MRRIVLLPLAFIACIAQHPPGSSLGTFGVSGALKTQTCGPSMQSQIEDPWTFDVHLSRNGSTMYWLQAAAPPLSGLVDKQGNVTFTSMQVFDLQDADAGKSYCGVVRTDTFTAALGTSPSPTSFTGKISYHYELDQNASCGGLLSGQFDAIPCDVSYDLTAKRK